MNSEKKFISELVTLADPFIIFSAKNVSYAIAIPTISNKIANKALKPELLILSPNFCQTLTPIKDPTTNIRTSNKSIDP